MVRAGPRWRAFERSFDTVTVGQLLAAAVLRTWPLLTREGSAHMLCAPTGGYEAGASICRVMPRGQPLAVAGCNCRALQPSSCKSAMPSSSGACVQHSSMLGQLQMQLMCQFVCLFLSCCFQHAAACVLLCTLCGGDGAHYMIMVSPTSWPQQRCAVLGDTELSPVCMLMHLALQLSLLQQAMHGLCARVCCVPL